MSKTTCYSMKPITPSTLITMTTLTTMASLPSSIYESSSVTFNNDTQAYTTVDINLSKITEISSWCYPNPLGPFTLNSVT